jgi:hypothetical protein
MRHGIVATALLYIALLITPPPALAGCAWVLWEKDALVSTNTAMERWEAHGAYTTQAKCATARLDKWKIIKRLSQRSLKNGHIEDLRTSEGHVSYGMTTGGYRSREVRCLPDTVYPQIKP